jgi:hypothetical protein
MENDEHWCGLLTSWIGKRKPHEPVVILGDLNMRLGAKSGDSRTNQRASTLFPLLNGWGFTFAMNNTLSPLARSTCVHGVGRGSVVDYIFYEPHRLKLLNYMVDEGDFGSDHLLIHCDMEFLSTRSINESITYKSWNIQKLKDKDIVEKYKEYFEEHFVEEFTNTAKEELNSQEKVDQVYQRLMEMVRETAITAIGQSDTTKWRMPLIHPLLPAIRTQCKILRKRCQLGDESAAQAFRELCVLRQEAIELASISIDRNWNRFRDNTDSMESTELLKRVHCVKSSRTRTSATKLSCESEAMGEHATHFGKQFSPPERARIHIREECVPNKTDSHIFFISTAIEDRINKYPRGKAAGPSGMKMELFKPIASLISLPLAKFFNELVKIGMVPTEWSRAHIIPVPKKPNSNSIKDFRPISLTEVLRKIFERCLLPEIIYAIGRAHFAQGGFERSKGTIDQISALNEVMQEKRKQGKRPCIAFLDICAAYDSADRNVLQNRLLSLGCPKYLTRIVMRLFDHNESHVALNGKISPRIIHRAGLLQGSTLSPTLYNCYIGGIQQKLIDANNGDPLTSFWYADDAAVVAEDTNTLQRILDVAQEHSYEINFRFNPKKCEVMNCEGKVLKLYDEPMPECKEFKYLGVWFTGDGADWKMHFDRRCEKARNAINFWKSVGMNGFGFKLRTKRAIYVSFIRPVFEYGLAICPDSINTLKITQRTQADALSALFGVYRNSSQAAMETLLSVTSMKYRRLELKARWIARMRYRSDEHMTTQTRSNCKRPRLKRLSCFADEAENPIILYHDQAEAEERRHFESTRGNDQKAKYKPRKLQRTILERRSVELRRVKEETKHCNFIPVYDDCKARFIYALSRSTVVTGRYISHWLIGRYIGKPVQCRIWYSRKASTQHLMECANINNIDELAGKGRWSQAMNELMKLFDAATGWEEISGRWKERYLIKDDVIYIEDEEGIKW